MLKCFYVLIWITVFKLCYCQRSMGLGNESILGKKYLVYFVKSPYSNTDDDAWICAGAIVTPTQILTAAACLVEINSIYVIAGYKKYVHGRDIENDKCTNTWKKKVVKISVPKEYTKSTGKQVEWMNVDVGVATVQEPYNFDDQSYLTHCSYAPGRITINYDKENESEKTRAIALGWGGEKVKNLKETTKEKLKPQLLQEATTTIIDKSFCADLVAKNGSIELVNKYVLCASGNGFLGEDGEETTLTTILEERLISSVSVSNNATESTSTNKDIDSGQINTDVNKSSKQINKGQEKVSSRKSSLLETCQNDHGGPLVTWVGTEEIILGVALNGICNPNFDCVGPRIYVSTASIARIIKCLLETNETRRKTCNDQIDDKRYQVNDIEIEWPEELKNSTTFPLSIQQIPPIRKQLDHEKTPLQQRQTREQDNLQEIPRKNLNNNPQQIQHDYPHGNLRANPQEISHNKPKENLHVNHQANDSQMNPYYKQQNPPQANQTVGSAGGRLEDQNWPLTQRRQQQVLSQYQSEIDNFNQPHFNRPPINSNYNPPQMVSKYQPQTKLYNQPLTQYDQNLMDLYSQMGLLKELHMAQYQPQQPINKHKSISNQINNSPLISINMPEPEMESLNQALINRLRLPQVNQLPALGLPYNMPQAESFKETVLPRLKIELLSTIHSNKKPTQSPYKNIQIESFTQEPAGSYNPLKIIMSQTEPEDILFEHRTVKPDKPVIMKPFQQPSVNPYLTQSINSALVKPFQQPQIHQLNSPNNVQRSQSHINSAPKILHQRDHALHPLQGASQTLEQMLSQLYASTSKMSAPIAAPAFHELYRKLHQWHEEPHNQKFETQFEPPAKREVEQINAKIMSEPPENKESKDNVQVRQQKPLEYPDYTTVI